MSSTVVIIPTRMEAKRLPNKPLKIIKQKEMILHVYDIAVKSVVGEVLVVTPDKIIFDLIKSNLYQFVAGYLSILLIILELSTISSAE